MKSPERKRAIGQNPVEQNILGQNALKIKLDRTNIPKYYNIENIR